VETVVERRLVVFHHHLVGQLNADATRAIVMRVVETGSAAGIAIRIELEPRTMVETRFVAFDGPLDPGLDGTHGIAIGVFLDDQIPDGDVLGLALLPHAVEAGGQDTDLHRLSRRVIGDIHPIRRIIEVPGPFLFEHAVIALVLEEFDS
jgi:hypothetical protein